MEKKNYLIIAAVLVIILSIAYFRLFESKKILLGNTYEELYSFLDYNINIIDTNMNEITAGSNGWQTLKKINTNDEKLVKTYNLLVLDIKKCYLLATDIKNKTYDNVKIMGFKNKEYATKDELLKLNNNEDCLKDFDKYNSMVLSNDQQADEKMRKQLSIIVKYNQESNTNKSFYELLEEELTNISKVASLTKWLKVEYYSHK